MAWPFARLAKAAADLKPDLVIHLGDYLYRESPCPEGNAGCAGSPYGDNWASWDADLFSPAAPLLEAAPWMIVRGNHEDCSRAGPGFLRLLGPDAFDPAAPCTEHLPPYAVTAGSQTIAVMDNASASDTSVDDKAVAVYRADFEALKAIANVGVGQELWLAAHRPIWAAITGPLGVPIGGNATLIAAAGDLSTFAAISLMLAGHIHTFEAINYDAKVPPQIVAGHGGDNLDPTPANLHGAIFQGHSGVSVKDGLSVGGFGFLMMTREAGSDGWSIQLYDSAGVPGAMPVLGRTRFLPEVPIGRKNSLVHGIRRAFVNIPPLSAPNLAWANCCASCTTISSYGVTVGVYGGRKQSAFSDGRWRRSGCRRRRGRRALLHGRRRYSARRRFFARLQNGLSSVTGSLTPSQMAQRRTSPSAASRSTPASRRPRPASCSPAAWMRLAAPTTKIISRSIPKRALPPMWWTTGSASQDSTSTRPTM